MIRNRLAASLLRLSTLEFMIRAISVITLGLGFAAFGAHSAVGPGADLSHQHTPELVHASLTYSGDDPVLTGSVNTLFESNAFVGPNANAKVDRAVPKFNLMAVAEQFTQARIRLAALETGPVDPSRQQSVIGSQELGIRPEEEAPRISVASIDPALMSAASASSALDAINGVTASDSAEPLDPSIPLPISLSEQLAYARDNTPSTVRASNPYSERERWCLSTAIYFEARGESYRGQVAVAQVVLNRVKHSAYPNTICGVVYQNASWRNRCQFSFACDGIPERINEPEPWRVAEEITEKVTTNVLYIPEVANATHYHASYVYPHWAPRMTRLTKIGLHIFYRFRT